MQVPVVCPDRSQSRICLVSHLLGHYRSNTWTPTTRSFHFGLITGVEIIMWIQDAHAAIQKRCFQHAKDVVRAQVRSFSFYLHNRSSLSLNLGMTSRYPKGGVQNAFHFDHTCQAFLTCCRCHICRFSVAAFSNSSRAQPREGKVARCEGNGNFARCEGNGNRRSLRKAV